jgi:glycosyltransferase involved in cell wall biosynthesis
MHRCCGSFLETLQKAYRWSTGDGEAGTNVDSYRWILIKLSVLLLSILIVVFLIALIVFSNNDFIRVFAVVLLILGFIYAVLRYRKRQSTPMEELSLAAIYSAEILGFIRGFSRRAQTDHKRVAGLRGVIFVLTIVPIDDTGGGARWTQLTLEFLRQQYLVFFVNKFPKYESADLNLEYKHPNLVTKSLSDFHWSSLYKKYRHALTSKPKLGIVELPLAEYVPIIEHLHALNAIVIYDLLDAWDTSLGGQWYEPEVEQQIIRSSDLFFATAPGLVEYLTSRTDETVHLVPNAVNSYLFNPQRSHLLPEDFPAGDWAIIYIGALWGEWFDWELLKKIALHYPGASLIVIGDTGNRELSMPGNIHFLGLKSQRDLPAYLHFSQVAIVPWEVNRITQMTSPLKIYEYLAMGRPVVAPMLDQLMEIPGVFCAEDHTGFIDMVGNLRDYQLPITEISDFIQENTWQARVDQIQVLVDQTRDAKKD